MMRRLPKSRQTEEKMSIQNIAVIGSGIMGSGAAQVSAAAGYQVTINDIHDEALSRESSPLSVMSFITSSR